MILLLAAPVDFCCNWRQFSGMLEYFCGNLFFVRMKGKMFPARTASVDGKAVGVDDEASGQARPAS